MELFKINYFDRAMSIFKEAFSFKKYKLMAMPFAIITAIVFLPFQIISLALGAIMLLASLFLRINFTLTTGWHKIVTAEGQIVKHAGQVVIYFFSWPFVLFSYVLSGIFLCLIAVCYVIFGCISYLWSLGGIKFKAFIGDSEDCTVNAKGRYPVAIPTVFTIITGVLLVVAPLIAAVVIVIDLTANNLMDFFIYDFGTAMAVCAGIELVFAPLYSFFAYARYPKQENEQIEE